MRKEAFKAKGYTGVDVFKVTQTLPVCKGTKTRRASGTERQERGKADTDCDETESKHTPPTETLPGKPAEQWAKKATDVVPQHVERSSTPPGSIGVITNKCSGNCLSCKQATAEYRKPHEDTDKIRERSEKNTYRYA